MPKLLMIGAASNCGATGHILEQLGLMARGRGWDVYTIHGTRHSNPSALTTLGQASKVNELTHAVYSLVRDGHGLGLKHFTRNIIEKIRDLKPDVIHLHNLHGYYINYRLLFEYLSTIDTPVVWTMHDFWAVTGHCVHFDFIGCDKWQHMCGDCPQCKSYPRSLVDKSQRNYLLKKRLFTSLDNLTVVPVSNWMAGVLHKSFLAKYPIEKIYNGIDTAIFKPTASDLRSRLNIGDKTVLVGVAYSWLDYKGYADYFKLREVLDDSYVIVMVGVSPKIKKNLPAGIIGIERLHDMNTMAQIYSMADATLNLSYQETFGMTTVEAMACGTPVIVYDRTASPELVTSDTGIVVVAGDINGVALAVQTIKTTGKQRYSEACIERVTALFDKDKCYAQYMDLYDKLLSQS